jgi:gliding motility associated protien GldN
LLPRRNIFNLFMKKLAVILFTMLCVGSVASAQQQSLVKKGEAEKETKGEKGTDGYNPNSVRGINESNVLWKTRVWRRLDMNEKQNQPFFSKNNEITKYLIDAVKQGLLDAYENDSLTRKLTPEYFREKLKYENAGGGLSATEKAAGFEEATDDGWGEPAKKDGEATVAKPKVSEGIEYFPQELKTVELMEDIIFDKQRSRIYYDIQAITVFIPAAATSRGFDVPVASFKYKDIDRYFRSNPSKFIWYNAQNEAQHKNMADAFDLRLFYGRIIKASNAQDRYLSDIYGSDRKGLEKSQQLEYKMMEWEHNLWEY